MSMMTLPGLELEDEQVPMVWPGSARVHESDPIESHLAADSITADGVKDSQEHVWLDLLGHGMSCAWEVEKRAVDRWSPSRIRTALKELEGAGRVVRHHLAGVTPSGRPCALFEAVHA